MSNRATKFVSVVFVYFLTSISFTAMVRGETATSDTCLANPRAETPPGSHWRYRTDHVNKRTCWYLRQDGEQSQTTAQNVSPAQPPQAAKPQPAKPSIADAHAELRGRADELAARYPAVRVNPNAVLAVVAIAQFMVILDSTVVNVALPTIRRDLGFLRIGLGRHRRVLRRPSRGADLVDVGGESTRPGADRVDGS